MRWPSSFWSSISSFWHTQWWSVSSSLYPCISLERRRQSRNVCIGTDSYITENAWDCFLMLWWEREVRHGCSLSVAVEGQHHLLHEYDCPRPNASHLYFYPFRCIAVIFLHPEKVSLMTQSSPFRWKSWYWVYIILSLCKRDWILWFKKRMFINKQTSEPPGTPASTVEHWAFSGQPPTTCAYGSSTCHSTIDIGLSLYYLYHSLKLTSMDVTRRSWLVQEEGDLRCISSSALLLVL